MTSSSFLLGRPLLTQVLSGVSNFPLTVQLDAKVIDVIFGRLVFIQRIARTKSSGYYFAKWLAPLFLATRGDGHMLSFG
jgi:hypothetical protein